MIDALARVLAYRFAIAFGDLPSAPLRRIPAPQTLSGFAEVIGAFPLHRLYLASQK